MDLPIEAFWMMLRNIDRIVADENYNFASRAAHLERGEMLVQYLEEMNTQRGEIVHYNRKEMIITTPEGVTKKIKEPVYERDKLMSLKGLGKIA
jgi:hypothetical protein